MFKILIASVVLLTFSCASQNKNTPVDEPRAPAQADIGSLKSGIHLNETALDKITETALFTNWKLVNLKSQTYSPDSQFDCSRDTFTNTNQSIWFRKKFRAYLIENHNFDENTASDYAKKVTSFISSKQTVVAREPNGQGHYIERCANFAELRKYLSQ